MDSTNFFGKFIITQGVLNVLRHTRILIDLHMNSTLTPTKPGQIVKIISDIADMESADVFIVSEDPSTISNDDNVALVSLKELQRNISQPEKAKRTSVVKNQLVVINDDLADYIKSWNDK